jgi:tetratricopeptide (TPR) repeat protein
MQTHPLVSGCMRAHTLFREKALFPHSMAKSDPIAAGIEALQQGDHELAIAAFSIALASELPDSLAARATSLRAQSHMLHGDLSAAMVDWREAWRLVLVLEDPVGEKALKGLRAQIGQARAARNAQQAQQVQSKSRLKTDLKEQLAQLDSAEDKLNLLVETANAHIDCGQMQDGLTHAQSALEQADDPISPHPRIQVLARLCILRVMPECAEELLETALQIADDANEPQLVAAVSRSAKSTGYEFKAIEF